MSIKTQFPSLPETIKAKYRSIQRVLTLSQVMQYIIMEDLPKSNLQLGQTKQRINRIHSDIDTVVKDLNKRFLNDSAQEASQDFTYGLYTVMSLLVDMDEAELYELGKELNERRNNNESIHICRSTEQ